ncbi:hypothetical protein ACFFX0_25170 [Citricoccus parietis]|uniref:Uncharacterized protein n=1 Tax=Citricoccus parietis TaxID=592307 RepID=A0ABV5G5U1_9MICC
MGYGGQMRQRPGPPQGYRAAMEPKRTSKPTSRTSRTPAPSGCRSGPA